MRSRKNNGVFQQFLFFGVSLVSGQVENKFRDSLNVFRDSFNIIRDSLNVIFLDSSGEMQWVVKCWLDGICYIICCLMKSKFLKERVKKILEECCGMIMDDDVMSELKFGCYWLKEECKKYIEKVCDYK